MRLESNGIGAGGVAILGSFITFALTRLRWALDLKTIQERTIARRA
jgi:hypothetical protein